MYKKTTVLCIATETNAWGRDVYVRDPTHNSIPSKIYYSSADQKESLKKA
jgi:hypothetical protein